VVDPRAEEQDLRRPTAQLADAAVSESRRRRSAHDRHESGTHADCARGFLPAPLAARIGKPQAITATARKLAILVYRALKGELVYRDPGADAYEGQQQTRLLRRLRQRAAILGFELVNRETGEVLPAGVS